MNLNTGEKSSSESQNFETIKYNTADNTPDFLLDNSCDPDVNFFNVNFQNFNTPYLLAEKFHNFLYLTQILHRSTFKHHERQRNIENFRLFLTSINFTFSVICFSETWLDDLTSSGNASYELPNYTRRHQVRGNRKGGGVSINIHNSLNSIIRPDLSISNNDIELLSAEIISEKVRNTTVLYRPPNDQIELFETFLKNTFSQMKIPKKPFHIAGHSN